MKEIHILCRTQFNLISDNDAVSWIQFYNISDGTICNGDTIYIYIDTTKNPFAKGIVLGTYKASSYHTKHNRKNENRLGIVFHLENPTNEKDLSLITWPNGRAHGESWIIK